MGTKSLSFMIENGLNLREVITTGSILHINQDFDESDLRSEQNNHEQSPVDVLGRLVPNFNELSKTMVAINGTGYVKKKIIEEGGGMPLHEGCTVSVALSGYWENDQEPFDVVPLSKPLEVDLKDNGLLPGLQMAINSMLVGETAVFLLSYQVMYGVMGVPPRIKPKANCVFYIKVVKSILTAKEGKINYSEPNMFQRVRHEVKLLYSSGNTLHSTKNYTAAIQLFKKAVNMLHRCRLADESEEKVQQSLLKKLYINLVVCYNLVNKPLNACSACNELNRLRSLWNNSKVLYQNAKALRMIGVYEEAERRLKKAMSLKPENEDLKAEYELLMKNWQASLEAKKNADIVKKSAVGLVSDDFKRVVDDLVRNFKLDDEENELLIPSHFNSDEIAYFKEVCIRENMFFRKIYRSELPCETENQLNEVNAELPKDYVLQKTEDSDNTKNRHKGSDVA